MARISFRCRNSRGTVFARRVAKMADPSEAREYATALVRSLFTCTSVQDWRKCRLYAEDESGKEMFVMPFWSVPTKPALKTRLKAAFARALS